MTAKDELRKELRAKRQHFVKSSNFMNDVTLFAHPALISATRTAHTVAGYVPLGSEADVMPFLALIAANDVPVALPYCADREAAIEFRYWVKGAPLSRSCYGFSQPEFTSMRATPDVILLPLVGFDRRMNRLGQGAGHYDRMLAGLPDALRIGIAWSVQEVEAIPTDPWDVPLDAVLTEKEWIMAPQSRIVA